MGHASWYYQIMNITIYRRMTQVTFILFIFLMPVFNIFRYDTATQEFFLFGNVWSLGLKQGFYADPSAIGALHIALRFFLKGILPWLVFLALFPVLGYFTGRFFCGWLCPEGALFELSDFLTLRLLGRRSLYSKKLNDPEVPTKNRLRYGMIALLSVVVIPLIGGVALTGYLVAPRTIWHQIATWHFTFGVKAGIIGVSIYMLVTSIFVRHVLCKFICAAGLMQMLFGWISPLSLRLGMDTARISSCTDCKGCDKACFMNVLPRKQKRDISCVNCGACIAACNRELGEGKGLFHLGFGKTCVAPAGNCDTLDAERTIDHGARQLS
jgi:ferredoxin-type protein NapH